MRLPLYLIVLTFCLACSEKKSNKQAEFKVRGNCSMCQNRIENSAKSIKGTESAEWNVDTKILLVKFDSTSTSELDIHKAVAAEGHGTEKVEMNKVAHDNLPDCCKVGGH